MNSPIRVLDAHTTNRWADVGALIFEYMGATQAELGLPVPVSLDELPARMQNECRDPGSVYRDPGVFLVACHGDRPIGGVGLKPLPGTDAVQVSRLYARPGHRGGTGKLLMEHAHRHAEQRGFARLVLDVMPQRHQVIGLYRRLGYTEVEREDHRSFRMLSMERLITPA
ncbi:GNAT family N-acetyltransferase [Streptosporangium sp. NPDC020145]|uniref:GNAT family N-acetyltransferase n=1 Tax=Streptosporangium sp. NPDC020145 TaxID=3154694 RepID=UPI0034371EA9